MIEVLVHNHGSPSLRAWSMGQMPFCVVRLSIRCGHIWTCMICMDYSLYSFGLCMCVPLWDLHEWSYFEAPLCSYNLSNYAIDLFRLVSLGWHAFAFSPCCKFEIIDLGKSLIVVWNYVVLRSCHMVTTSSLLVFCKV